MNKPGLDEQNKALMSGVRQLLGKEPSSVTPIVAKECVHESDGFVYADTPLSMTLMCIKCGTHYDVKR